VYDVGQGEGNNDEGLNSNVNQDPNDIDYLDVHCARSDVPAFEVEQPQ
jgi:hypothetical protein